MYIIRNITNGKVIIGDLNLVLKQKEEKDLDRYYPRPLIDTSLNLRHAISKKFVELVQDDKVLPETEKEYIFPAAASPQLDQNAISAMEKRILSALSQEISGLKAQDGKVVEQKLDALLQALKSGSRPVSPADQSEEMDIGVDADKLLDIHARAIERISRNAEGHVSGKQEVVKSDVNDRADELDDII